MAKMLLIQKFQKKYYLAYIYLAPSVADNTLIKAIKSLKQRKLISELELMFVHRVKEKAIAH